MPATTLFRKVPVLVAVPGIIVWSIHASLADVCKAPDTLIDMYRLRGSGGVPVDPITAALPTHLCQNLGGHLRVSLGGNQVEKVITKDN